MKHYSQQPWCTYALHIATFTSLAFAIDPLLLASCWWATAKWELGHRQYAFWAQFVFMFGFTKVVKLVGLFRRNPADFVYLPLSIAFGYFHGLIKLYALLTLNMVCTFPAQVMVESARLTLRQTSWGSRADGDAHDEQRLAPAPQPSVVLKTPPGTASLIRYNVRHKGRQSELRDGTDASQANGCVAYDSSTSYTPIRVPSQGDNEKFNEKTPTKNEQFWSAAQVKATAK
jgi:hypothetical protein